MPISQKPKDVLHIIDVQIKKITFLSHNLGITNSKIALKATSIHYVSLFKNLQN